MRRNWHAYYVESLTVGGRVADAVTKASGTWTFLAAHVLWWGYWLALQHFDRFPFGLLTMILSLEAILLATLVLMSQNRAAVRDRVAQEHRDHMQDQIEKLIETNTALTEEIHKNTEEIHASVVQRKGPHKAGQSSRRA